MLGAEGYDLRLDCPKCGKRRALKVVATARRGYVTFSRSKCHKCGHIVLGEVVADTRTRGDWRPNPAGRLRRNPWVQDELGWLNRTPPQHTMLTTMPEGYFAEWPIDVPAAWQARGAPPHYWVDIANPRTKTAIELDDPSHRREKSVAKDTLKDQVLRSMGWTVRRVQTSGGADNVVVQNPRQNPRRSSSPSTIQTLLFPTTHFSVSTAKEWAKAHGYNASNEDILVPSRSGGKYIHIRQQDPKQGQGLRWVTYTLDKAQGVRATAFVRETR